MAFIRENEVSGLIYPMAIYPNGRIAMNKGQRGVPEHPLHVGGNIKSDETVLSKNVFTEATNWLDQSLLNYTKMEGINT